MVIKVLRRHADDQVRRRVLDEARHTAALSDPAVVTVFSVLDETDPPAIVMEFVEGYSLDRFTAQLNFDWHILADTGSIQQVNEWGPGGAFGFRLGAHLQVRIWRGLFTRLGGFVEYYALSLDQTMKNAQTQPPCPCRVSAGGASDAFYGGQFGFGYSF